jgi:DNA-directed RNA polymerase subunit RPC12/RpoP
MSCDKCGQKFTSESFVSELGPLAYRAMVGMYNGYYYRCPRCWQELEPPLIERIEITDETLAVLDDAVATFGAKSQLLMAVEEMSELQKEICKHFRNSTEISNAELVDEVADVIVTVYQAARLCGIEAVNRRIDFKIDRLKNKIKHEKER